MRTMPLHTDTCRSKLYESDSDLSLHNATGTGMRVIINSIGFPVLNLGINSMRMRKGV